MSQQINLYNPLFLQREKHFSAVTILWSLLAVSVVLAAYCAYVSFSIRGPQERARYFELMLQSKRSEMTDTVARYSPEGRNKQLEASVRDLESLLASREKVWRALNNPELGTGSGFSGYLDAFSRQVVAGVWLTGFSIGGGAADLSIQGRVLRPELVSVFLSALGKEEIMRGRKLVELKLEARQAPLQAQSAAPATGAGAPVNFIEFSVRVPAALPAQGEPAGNPAQAAPGAAR